MKTLLKKLLVISSLIAASKSYAAQNIVKMVRISSDNNLDLAALETLGDIKVKSAADKQVVLTINDEQNFSFDNFLNDLKSQIGDQTKLNKISIEIMSVGTQDWTRVK